MLTKLSSPVQGSKPEWAAALTKDSCTLVSAKMHETVKFKAKFFYLGFFLLHFKLTEVFAYLSGRKKVVRD